jgi:transposase
MRTPIMVRPLTDAERQAVTAGLRSSDAFVLRRCQILLASARGERAPRIAEQLGCDDQTVLDALHAFNAHGLQALRKGSSRPKRLRAVAFGPAQAEALRALLHHSPRRFGQPTSLWTLEMAAEVSFAQGLTATRVTGETIRATLRRLGIGWKRAKHWITSPDPAYARKKGSVTA